MGMRITSLAVGAVGHLRGVDPATPSTMMDRSRSPATTRSAQAFAAAPPAVGRRAVERTAARRLTMKGPIWPGSGMWRKVDDILVRSSESSW